MEMLDIEDLAEEVMSGLPGVDSMQAEDKLHEAAIEFFRTTALWKHEMPWINTYAGEPNYRLNYPLSSQPERIQVARFKVEDGANPYLLHPRSELELEREYGGEWESIVGTPRRYLHIDDPEVVRLVPIPDLDLTASLFIRLQVIPARNAKELPAILTNKYWQAIAAGAKMKLTSMKDQPWSDPDAARKAEVKFNDGKARGINDRAQGHTGHTQKMMAEYPLA